MKKSKYFLSLILLLMFILSFVACGFVDYIAYDDGSEESDISDITEEYVSKIKNLSSYELYREEEAREYERTVIDAENELRECTTLEQLEQVYQKHYELIMSIPTDYLYLLQSMLDRLYSYVSLDDYREAEQVKIQELLEKYESGIRQKSTLSDMDMLFRAFQTEIYGLKTQGAYLADELAALKQEYIAYCEANFDITPYRQNERNTLLSLKDTFIKDLEAATDAVSTTAIYNAYVDSFNNVPTDAYLFSLEKSSLISSWVVKLDSFASKFSISDRTQISDALTSMEAQNTLASINRTGASAIMSLCEDIGDSAIVDMRDAATVYVNNAVDRSLYFQQTLTEIDHAASSAAESISSQTTVLDVLGIMEYIPSMFEAFPTRDEFTASLSAAFLQRLHELYGDNILEPPQDMNNATSYEELAAIIDYYAFYQISASEFVCGTFTVNILFPFQSAQYEINEVYWYCELIRSAVGITGEFKEGTNALEITLIPYDLASVSNTETPKEVDRYTSLVEYDSQNNSLEARGEYFEAFPYLTQYTKSISGIWNTQQLWYALEHEYIPITVPGSPAEAALERAKEILREIIYEGMTEEEKIFAIFSWFGENVTYDYGYNTYLYPSDRDHFPDELVATLNSFHVEGALFDNLAVCCSFAKAYLLMLRIEGIEAYRILVHSYTNNAINNNGNSGYGSHAFVAIRMSDGKFYYSDTEESYFHSESSFVKLHQLALSPTLHTPYENCPTKIFTDLVYGEGLSPLMTEKLVYNGQSIFIESEAQLNAILEAFAQEEGTGISVSILCMTPLDFSPEGIVSSHTSFDYVSDTYKNYTEYVIYK